jgi:hypothetical protein
VVLSTLEELAAWTGWFGRSGTAAELSTIRKVPWPEHIPSLRPAYETIPKTPNLRQSDEFSRQLGTHKPDFNSVVGKRDLAAPDQDSTASVPADQTSKSGPLIGGSIATGGTYCAYIDCFGQRRK